MFSDDICLGLIIHVLIIVCFFVKLDESWAEADAQGQLWWDIGQISCGPHDIELAPLQFSDLVRTFLFHNLLLLLLFTIFA